MRKKCPNTDQKKLRIWTLFKNNLLNFIRPCANSIFNIHNSYGIKLLIRFRPGFSHLCDHKFRHCFQDTINPLCDCGSGTETMAHFFLRCTSFHSPRQTLLNNIRNINKQIFVSRQRSVNSNFSVW